MKLNERFEASNLMDALPSDIVSYYREPSDSKLRAILSCAARLRHIEGDGWYQVCVDLICIRILYACDHAFIDRIEKELLNIKN